MIKDIEEKIYQFLIEILKEKKVQVFRGMLPEKNHEDREKGKQSEDYFPFVLLRVTHFEQTRAGFDAYDTHIDFEFWIGTKEEKEENYINNLELGDFLREKMLEQSTRDNGFALDQAKGFQVDFYSDQAEPYFYSKCQFTTFGIPATSIVAQNKINELLGRRKS